MSVTTITYSYTPPPGSTADVDYRLVALCDPASFVGVVTVDGGGHAVQVNPTTWAGLTRTDTGALVASVASAQVGGVATPIAPVFNASSAAYVYTYGVTDPAAGLVYSGWLYRSVGGIGSWREFSKAGTPATGSSPTFAAGQIITQDDLATFLGAKSLGIMSQQDGAATTIDVPTVQQAIYAAEGRILAALGQLRARSGSSAVTTFFKVPLTVNGVPVIQATNSVALPVLQAVAVRYAARWLNSRRSIASAADYASGADPADTSRGLAMVASTWDKAATAEMKRIVRWATGYTEDATYVDLDLSPGAIIGAPYQGIQAPRFAGATVEPSGHRVGLEWGYREGVGLGWGWW
jgi:hypothetical protein